MIVAAGNHEAEAGRARQALNEAHMGCRRLTGFDETLAYVEWYGPLVLVLDLDLVHGNSLKLIRAIRATDKHPYRRTRIVVLAGSTAKAEIVELFEAGATDVLLPGWKNSDLRVRVSWLNQKQNDPDRAQKRLDSLPDIVGQKDIDAIVYRPDWLAESDPLEMAQARMARRKKRREDQKEPVLTYDFKHPSRVSREQTRTLENLHTNFARMIAANFSRAQQSIVDVDIAFVDQTTYANLGSGVRLQCERNR